MGSIDPTGGGMAARDYRDLVVWQRAQELVRAAYGVARRLPVEERFELASQIRRAATSVTANIAEGHSRPYRRDFLRYLATAYASLKELDNHLLTVESVGYVHREHIADALSLAQEVSKMLTAMRRRLAE
jgi:four helix bundle protein